VAISNACCRRRKAQNRKGPLHSEGKTTPRRGGLRFIVEREKRRVCFLPEEKNANSNVKKKKPFLRGKKKWASPKRGPPTAEGKGGFYLTGSLRVGEREGEWKKGGGLFAPGKGDA